MKSIFLDTGYLLALELSNDQNHRAALKHWRSLRIPEQSDRSFRSERDQRFRAKVTVDSTVNVTAFRHQRNR